MRIFFKRRTLLFGFLCVLVLMSGCIEDPVDPSDQQSPQWIAAPSITINAYPISKVSLTIDEPGTVYYCVVPDGTPPIVSAGDLTNIGSVFSFEVQGNTAITFPVSNLSMNTSYDIYLVCMDINGNLSDTVTKIDLNVGDIPTGYLKIRFYLDCSSAPLTNNLPRLMGFTASGFDSIEDPSNLTYDSWALAGTNNIMTNIPGTDVYSLVVLAKLHDSISNGYLEYKYTTGSAGFSAMWNNEMSKDSCLHAQNNYTAGSYTMVGVENGSGGIFTLSGFSSDFSVNDLSITNFGLSWNGQWSTKETQQATTVTVSITNVNAFTNVGSNQPYDFSTDYNSITIVGGSTWISSDGNSLWANGTAASSYNTDNNGTIVFELTAPLGTRVATFFMLYDAGSGGVFENGYSRGFELPENSPAFSVSFTCRGFL